MEKANKGPHYTCNKVCVKLSNVPLKGFCREEKIKVTLKIFTWALSLVCQFKSFIMYMNMQINPFHLTSPAATHEDVSCFAVASLLCSAAHLRRRKTTIFIL